MEDKENLNDNETKIFRSPRAITLMKVIFELIKENLDDIVIILVTTCFVSAIWIFILLMSLKKDHAEVQKMRELTALFVVEVDESETN